LVNVLNLVPPARTANQLKLMRITWLLSEKLAVGTRNPQAAKILDQLGAGGRQWR